MLDNTTIAAVQDDGRMNIIDDATQRIIDEVREKTKRKFDKSKLLQLATQNDGDDDGPAVDDFILPRLDIHDLILGKVLGQGGFGTVIEIMPRVISVDDVVEHVPRPPPPQDDIVEVKKNSPRSDRGNGYTFNWWKLQWDENITDGDYIVSSHDCIPGDTVSLLDCIVHITSTAASSFASSSATNSTLGLTIAVGDSILPLCNNIEKRQQLSHVGLHSGVEYVLCSIEELMNADDEDDLLVSLKPSYPLGPQFQVDWPIRLLASDVPVWTSRNKMMTQNVTTKQRGGRDHPISKSLPSSSHDNNETIFHDHWMSSSRKGMTVHPERRRKSISHDVSRMRYMRDDTIQLHHEHDDDSPLLSQQEEASSHYFSFLEWRDSQAGEERGNMKKEKKMRNSNLDLANESYVIKKISQSIVDNDFNKFIQAAKDLATETNFLTVLGQHPHVLNIRAVGQGDFFSPNFFLVLDRLHGTLYDKIDKSWKTLVYDLENSFFVYDRVAKLKTLWNERIGVMKDLAGALSYMHDMRIIYRDIKPDNVGFDGHGIVKLFDFGLAREIYAEEDTGNGTYKLTHNTGSLRYMAPEVFNKWPYSFFADTFSFSILLWEVAALERPYNDLTPSEIREMVIKWGARPVTKDAWSDRVVDLMTTSWDSNYRKRPTMKEIEANLEMEIADSVII